ncbi:aryl-alcohol dehydrogenase [Paenibacillus sp. FSL H7-0326]|uniref:NAD(P)-dependent alcohol dehydrogenase n=1 Tax=Paenibacillus sp. FSL H7-0326 TaxID=1921144 RepID=UPI00096C68D9|nr:NAD(P)-dependent alcohol dehydrogenase [Paenibacillus sp. FSL H7-0326]OMC72089.1 aryl-alcohol dehydrogenase [Paenibacillus sp. FSL H7-0326]
MKIKAAITKDNTSPFELEEIEIAEPKANEVLVRIVASGVCHTDATARDASMVPFPAVLGHEGSGVVEKVGANVTTVVPGDHVVLSFASCGHCENCLVGMPAYCHDFMALNFAGVMKDGTSPLEQHGHRLSNFFGQSSFATFAIANERSVVKVDKDVDLALLGPLGCGIQTGSGTVLNTLKPSFGETIAIFGAGGVGLSAVMAAHLIGCSKVIVLDIVDSRLELAKELGATHVINSKSVDAVEEIRKITGGGVNYTLDTTGLPFIMAQAVEALKPLGTAAYVAGGPDLTKSATFTLGKRLVASIEGDAVPQLFIPKLIEYYKQGRFPFDKLVKFYDFSDINKAFADSKSGVAVKPIVKMN